MAPRGGGGGATSGSGGCVYYHNRSYRDYAPRILLVGSSRSSELARENKNYEFLNLSLPFMEGNYRK